MARLQTYQSSKTFKTESGGEIQDLEIAFTTSGKINKEGSNVVWICHAFTADANPEAWWPNMVGENKFFSPEKYFIICANILGSCYGTTGPRSIQPKS